MDDADQCLRASNSDGARALYAEAVEAGLVEEENSLAALCLVMTFERGGVLDEEKCRAWILKRFAEARARNTVEQALRDYGDKFAFERRAEGLDGQWAGGIIEAPSELLEGLRLKTHALAYDELIRCGEALYRQEKAEEARRLYAKALALEPETEGVSRAATNIVQTFREPTGVNLAACKAWAEANVSNAEARRRIDLAIGTDYYRDQDYDKAIGLLKDVASQEGHAAESASLVVALCLQAKGESDAALARLDRLAKESSAEEIAAKALFLIGWTHLQAQNYAAAKEAFSTLVGRYPDSELAAKANKLIGRMESYIE
jgi:TolA-binding protein